MLRLKTLFRFAISAAALVLVGSTAKAGDPVSCAAYANIAVAQQNANLTNGCGFTGPRWHGNYGAHFSWCLTVPHATANSERVARVNQLQSCTGSGWPAGKARRCNIYATVAIGQQNANVNAGCGFGGPRWQANYNAHYNWCMGTAKINARNETNARMQQLRNCAP